MAFLVSMILNPILPGFHPDPSIIRVGDDYYIANSTFEWFPGVRLHHSRDLKHWRTLGHILTRESQLDLKGVPNSGGVWAPSLSHADGRFWLMYTNVRHWGLDSPYMDVGVYLTTADSIEGPWSDPVSFPSFGFDPSLFHDDDGRKWYVNVQWDFRKGKHRFSGIVLQEYDPVRECVIGAPRTILQKEGIIIEGPNLYKKDGWYYLMLAEGGTEWGHGISLARSRQITGPYELDPQPMLITSRDDSSLKFQKAGHGEIVQTQSGEWYLAHLASRPLQKDGERRCVLGRETCLQRVEWSDEGWLRLAHGGWHPAEEVAEPSALVRHAWPEPASRDDFEEASLDANWASLRGPVEDSWLSLSQRPGWLRLKGRASLHSLQPQSLVAKRLQSFEATIETCLEFEPDHFSQMAGLVCWYDTKTHYYLRVTHDASRGKVAGIVLSDCGVADEVADTLFSLEGCQRIYLRAEVRCASLQFLVSREGSDWVQLGPVLDMTKLSDDYGGLRFTGAFAGLCVQDANGTGVTADFDYFQII